MFSKNFSFIKRLALVSDDLTIFKENLGRRIKFLRLKHKLTQPDLADKLKVDFQSISRIENGRINPSAHTLLQISEALGEDMNSLFDFKNNHEI